MADVTAPATHAALVTKSDATVFSPVSRAIWVGGAGNLEIQTAANEIVTVIGVAGGTLLPISVLQIRAATTATNMLIFW
jgi:hypothetical protein